MGLTVGEHLLVKKVVKEVFSESKEITEVCLKQKYYYYLDLDDADGRVDTNDYVDLKIIKKDDENYIVERILKEEVTKRLYNVRSSVLENL